MKEELTARLEAKIVAEIKPSNGKSEVFRSTLVFRTDGIHEEIIAKMDAHQERLEVSVNAWRKETTACHEATETCLESKEPTSVETESAAMHEEVAVKTVRALKKRYGDRQLAPGRRRQLKRRIQGDGGSRKTLAVARRRMTRRAITAQRKGHGRRGPGEDNIASGVPKERKLERRKRTLQESSNGIRDRDLKEQLRLGSKRTFNKTVRKTFGLEVTKPAVQFPIGLQKMSDWTLWRGRPPQKRKKRLYTEQEPDM
jgi:hypothetical protein